MKDVKIEDLKKTIEITENAVIEMVAFTKKIEKENFDLEMEIKYRKDTNKDEINYRNELIAANEDLKAENEDLEGDLADLRVENSEYVAYNSHLNADNEEFKAAEELLEKEIKDRIEISKDEFRYRNELRTELRQLRDEKDEFENSANYWMKNYKELENKNSELKVATLEAFRYRGNKISLENEVEILKIKINRERREHGDLHARLIKQHEDLNKELTEIKSSLWKWLQSYWREGTGCY